MNEPKKHHFFAQFHLRAWAEKSDGKIPTYQRGSDDTIKLRRSLPENTGCEGQLYALDNVPAEQRQMVETKFFGAVDDEAAPVYRKLVDEGAENLTTDECRAWTHYVMAQRARVPEIVKHLRTVTSTAMVRLLAEHDDQYVAIKSESGEEGPATALEWFDQKWPGRRSNTGLQILMRVIMNQGVANQISQMYWWVYDARDSCVPVLASDRPYCVSHGIDKPDCVISLPLTPSKLFIASPNMATLEAIARQSIRKIVRDHNHAVVCRADRAVYGHSDMIFVQRYMNTAIRQLPKTRYDVD